MKDVVRTYQVDNRLAKAIDAPGGMTVGDALTRAAANIEEVRDECLIALDAKIAEIDAATARGAFKGSAEEMARVYALANELQFWAKPACSG